MRAVTDPLYVPKRNALIPKAELWAIREGRRTGEAFNALFLHQMQVLAEREGLTASAALRRVA